MKEKKIKRIPYGLTNYERVVQDNCYYVDKTMYLKTVEKAGDYLFFIRPRRFGKSLFLSVMEAYYDVYYKDRFGEFFKETAVYNDPTGERGTYLVLKFNFSMVDPALRVEYKKLRHLIIVDRDKRITTNGNFNQLKEIIEEGETSSKIEKGFPLEKLVDPENFKSLLFYLGLLTIESPEKELNKGFADLVLEPFLAQYPGIRFSYLIEVKYLKSTGSEIGPEPALVQSLREEAEEQLKQYSGDEKFKKTIGQTKLVKLVLVFCGRRLAYKGEA